MNTDSNIFSLNFVTQIQLFAVLNFFSHSFPTDSASTAQQISASEVKGEAETWNCTSSGTSKYLPPLNELQDDKITRIGGFIIFAQVSMSTNSSQTAQELAKMHGHTQTVSALPINSPTPPHPHEVCPVNFNSSHEVRNVMKDFQRWQCLITVLFS